MAGHTAVKARRFVVASGSVPAVPPIAGIDTVPYLPNETVFDLAQRPAHLIVIGGEPIGPELAQAQRRRGARGTLLELHRVLGRDVPEIVDFARPTLSPAGVAIHVGNSTSRVASHAQT